MVLHNEILKSVTLVNGNNCTSDYLLKFTIYVASKKSLKELKKTIESNFIKCYDEISKKNNNNKKAGH